VNTSFDAENGPSFYTQWNHHHHHHFRDDRCLNVMNTQVTIFTNDLFLLHCGIVEWSRNLQSL